jgi:hypothetical protein
MASRYAPCERLDGRPASLRLATPGSTGSTSGRGTSVPVYAPRHDDARIALVHAGRAIVPVNESQITSTQRESLGIAQPRF